MANLSRLKINIVNAFPFVSVVSRYFKAMANAAGTEKKSYSQHGEDAYVWDLLSREFPGEKCNYIDVGGFHPTLISNTYLLYRKKMTGAVVEPNPELAGLHKKFRPNDIQLEVACSNVNTISKFYFQKTFPALSSLNNGDERKKITCSYVPVFNLDTIYKSIGFDKIHFLSVDVEGFDFEVLEGGQEALNNTYLLCVESNTPEFENKIKSFLSDKGFVQLTKFACNLIFKNQQFNNSSKAI